MKKNKKPQNNNIIIVKAPLDTDVNNIFNDITLFDDENLIESIIEYADELKENNIEIFKHDKNIIATSDGYFCAFYERDLRVIDEK